MIRAAVLLATMPAAMFSSIATWRTLQYEAPPPEPTRVQTEGITARLRNDDHSFTRRWALALDFPPATNATTMTDAVPIDTASTNNTAGSKRRIVMRVARLDVCQRHRMHKQHYRVRGWSYWRCRK